MNMPARSRLASQRPAPVSRRRPPGARSPLLDHLPQKPRAHGLRRNPIRAIHIRRSVLPRGASRRCQPILRQKISAIASSGARNRAPPRGCPHFRWAHETGAFSDTPWRRHGTDRCSPPFSSRSIPLRPLMQYSSPAASLAGSSFAALQALSYPTASGDPTLCHLVPGLRLRGICGKTSDAKRTKDIRIICRPGVHGCPRIPALDQSTQGGPSGFDVNGGEFHRSNSLE